jgi:hypothetical protein
MLFIYTSCLLKTFSYDLNIAKIVLIRIWLS